MPRAGKNRWSLRRWITVTIGAAIALCVAGIVLGAITIARLSDARVDLVDRIDPALQHALRLDAALVDQETGVRGFALSQHADFLAPYTLGLERAEAAEASLRGVAGGMPGVLDRLNELDRLAQQWRDFYAEPVVTAAIPGDDSLIADRVTAAKAMFDQVRATSADLQRELESVRIIGRDVLDDSASQVTWVSIGLAVMLLLVFVVLILVLRSAFVGPLTSLAGQVRKVADGDFQHAPKVGGPREIVVLAQDVDSMRQRIVDELAAQRDINAELDLRTEDLARSNSELEQFAYVASHDLQEPLRKVASFCQLLERRYKGQLDERADQYIGFAVDGAKRMQILINDLLAFSRVGRHVNDHVSVPTGALVDQAVANLNHVVEESGATVEKGELPVVRGEAALLTAVFQNLVGNAVKFRGEDPPRIAVAAVRDGEFWEFTFSDNGIGIQPEYAERVFVIFQRLHPKDEYPGTGIGLSMCRKIIEYHGGRIWLDPEYAPGTRFRFTLPAIDTLAGEDAEAPETPDVSEETQ
ncbi:ATP-binding protein [Actinokineospora guangxiensis]|uniref:histidine kinase n=1 Tax=Actinokineospora guangxiensis TaxID=1490288 RepID=A0ABW0EV94_9PSEU